MRAGSREKGCDGTMILYSPRGLLEGKMDSEPRPEKFQSPTQNGRGRGMTMACVKGTQIYIPFSLSLFFTFVIVFFFFKFKLFILYWGIAD